MTQFDLSDHLMVGVTTGQNTANLIPATQLDADEYLPINTSKAKTEGWGRGMQDVLKDRGIGVVKEAVDLGREEEGRIEAVTGAVWARVKSEQRSIAWLIGGGLTTLRMGLWRAFERRCREFGRKDCAVYANPDTRQTSIARMDTQGDLSEEQLPTRSSLKVDEIVRCFNLQIKSGERLPSEPLEKDAAAECESFLKLPNQRQSWYNQHVRTGAYLAQDERLTLQELNDNLHGNKSVLLDSMRAKASRLCLPNDFNLRYPGQCDQALRPLLNSALDFGVWTKAIFASSPPPPRQTPLDPTPILYFSRYFELLVIHLVRAFRAANEDCAIVDALANVRLEERPDALSGAKRTLIEMGEHDVLLSDTAGTLTSLDAKTFDFPKNEIDRRLHNLQSASGQYGKLVAVFPFFKRDVEDGSLPSKLLELPFRLSEFRTGFLVVGDYSEPMHVRHSEHGAVEWSTSRKEDSVLCKPLEWALSRLGS